jgi:hypothetical protein
MNLKGKMFYDLEGKSYYEGDWIDDEPFGWGIRRYPSGKPTITKINS